MKKSLLTLVCLFVASVTFGQYYYIKYENAGENPGNLNNDNEFPVGGGLPGGWTTLVGGPKASPEWSAAQTMPITFLFNGLPVTSYKVSTSGVLTFNTAASNVPGEANEALPSADIPDNSIAVWGLNAASGDNIIMKTFGTAPNRQMWIQFNSFSEAGLQSGWAYWSIVLEETTNTIYVVDQRNNCVSGGQLCNGKTSLTVGIQIDGTTAVQVAGSPQLQNLAGNDATPVDNSYYAFYPGTQPQYDVVLNSLDIPATAKKGTDIEVKGTLANMGSELLTSFDLHYTVDGGSTVTMNYTGQSIAASGGQFTFTHNTPFQGANGGDLLSVDVWIDNINGNADENPNDNMANAEVYINEGIAAEKMVMIEEGTGAWCIHCPDAHTYLDNIIKNNPGKIVPVLHHNSDAMTNPESNTINAAYANGYPNGFIDRRVLNDPNYGLNVGQGRGGWAGHTATVLNEVVPVKVNIINKNWDANTRMITFDVEAEFVDYAAGNMRIGAMIIENHIRGVGGASGNSYDQSIASTYTNNPNHIYYNKKSPMVGYFHPKVCINIPSGAWGRDNTITANATPGDKFTASFSYKLPPTTTVTIPESAEFKPTGVVEGRNKEDDIILVGFVAEYDSDIEKRPILNSNQEKLTPGDYTSAKPVENALTKSSVYPNPVQDIGTVNFDLEENKNITVTLHDLSGKQIAVVKQGAFAAGNHSVYFSTENYANGVYLVKVSGENVNAVHKVVIQK